eukprot:371474_1
MCTNQSSEKWIHLTAPPCLNFAILPTGVDKNNYIIIDWNWRSKKINCIYKYNTNTDKWGEISGCNNIKNISYFSAALNVKKQMLFLVQEDQITQIQLNSGNVNNNTFNVETNYPLSSCKSIIVNNSLFSLGGLYNNSILKWNSDNKTFTQFGVMYNKKTLESFAMIYNDKNNCLLFGGYDYDKREYVDYILEFNMNTKQWNKL